MEQTSTVDGCLLFGVSLNFEKNMFSSEELTIGTRTDGQIDSSKTAYQKISRKPKDKESANEENKQFDPGGKGGEPPL